MLDAAPGRFSTTHLPVENLADLGADHAGRDVGGGAGRKAADDADRRGRIGLRLCRRQAGGGHERGEREP